VVDDQLKAAGILASIIESENQLASSVLLQSMKGSIYKTLYCSACTNEGRYEDAQKEEFYQHAVAAFQFLTNRKVNRWAHVKSELRMHAEGGEEDLMMAMSKPNDDLSQIQAQVNLLILSFLGLSERPPAKRCACAFSDRTLHSRMPMDPAHVRLKLLHACDQWHSSRESTALTVAS
jgi:hypothetical protein